MDYLAEIERLAKENKKLREEIAILKLALAEESGYKGQRDDDTRRPVGAQRCLIS